MITVTKETALKLKEAGWTKECVFKLFKDSDGHFIGQLDKTECLPARNGNEPFFIGQAPTAQELMEKLPEFTHVWFWEYKEKKGTTASYDGFTIKEIEATVDGYNAAEALALLWLKLKEENLI